MDWDDLRLIVVVAQSGSVRRAAEVLGVNHSTVSRRINIFEKKLGVKVFDRTPRGFTMTSAGEEILTSARYVEDEIAELERRVLGRDLELSGTLHVTLAEALAINLLMSDLTKFTNRYPNIDLKITISYEEFSLLAVKPMSLFA